MTINDLMAMFMDGEIIHDTTLSSLGNLKALTTFMTSFSTPTDWFDVNFNKDHYLENGEFKIKIPEMLFSKIEEINKKHNYDDPNHKIFYNNIIDLIIIGVVMIDIYLEEELKRYENKPEETVH